MSAIAYVARHGETTWNVAGRYQGRLESPLSRLGIAEGKALANYFATDSDALREPPARIVSSPLGRCTETAAFVAQRLGMRVDIDERLIEIDHGTWQGRYRDELAANDPERYWAWKHDPEDISFERGESLRDVRERWRSFAASLIAKPLNTLIVTHDAVCRIALLDTMHRALSDFRNVHVENAAFARLAIGQRGLTVIEECHTQHLAGLRASLETQAL